MPKKVRKAKKSKPGPQQMPPKWLVVIDLMTIGGLVFQDAMAEAGYSPKYYKANGYRIQQDTRFRKLLELKRAKRSTKTEDLREEVVQYLCGVYRDTGEMTRDRNAAAKELGSICGWHSETIRHETTDRQQLLDDAGRQEAARMAALSLDTRSLPDVTLSRKAVTSLVTQSTVPVGSHTANEYVTGDTESDSPDSSDTQEGSDNEPTPTSTGNPKNVRQA